MTNRTPLVTLKDVPTDKQETTPLIPRNVLFGNPDRATPRLSPDGARIAYLAPVEGVLNVWVGPTEDLAQAKPVTHDRARGIRMYFWAYTSQHIIYLQDKGGDENWRAYSVDLTTGKTIDLTPMEGVQARIQEVSQKFPDEIIVGLNDRDAQLHDLYRVNIGTSERQLVHENEGFAGYVTDEEFNVRFAVRLTPDGGSETLKPSGEGEWEMFAQIGPEDSMTTHIAGFDETGRLLYMLDSRDRDTGMLRQIDLDTGEEKTLAEDPRADISGVMVHPKEGVVQAAASTYERKRWQVLDDRIAGDLAYLDTVADGEVEVVSRSIADDLWIVAFLVDNGPLGYYLYNRAEKRADFLFYNRPELKGLPLTKMHPAVIPARDGLNLVSYYTLPIASDPEGTGRPEAPLPMVLEVHGGPWSRDGWGYNAGHQVLANRGYAVVSVNFRGSTGFGKSFINAGDFEWGGKMHDDLIDAVKWAIDEGIADPDRIAIMGGSYGGYATLVGLSFAPDVFACGVDIVGPSSLVTLLESIPPYWKPIKVMFTSRVGDDATEDGMALLNDRSPLNRVDRIEKPLLIGQGANDPRVKQQESDQIVRAMQEKEIPVTYVLFSDEGHGFARPENNLSFFAVAEAFLATYLGGRFEPVGDDFQGASISVPAGASFVPGLEEAIGIADAGAS